MDHISNSLYIIEWPAEIISCCRNYFLTWYVKFDTSELEVSLDFNINSFLGEYIPEIWKSVLNCTRGSNIPSFKLLIRNLSPWLIRDNFGELFTILIENHQYEYLTFHLTFFVRKVKLKPIRGRPASPHPITPVRFYKYFQETVDLDLNGIWWLKIRHFAMKIWLSSFNILISCCLQISVSCEIYFNEKKERTFWHHDWMIWDK